MNINLQPSILDNIEIASPCSVSWDDMKGNDQVRDCSQCQLSVYNLSTMSKKEAEALIREREGRLCVRLYRRADGTVITDNCPVALRKVRDSFRNLARIAAALISFLLTLSIARAGNENAPGGNSCQPSNSAAGEKLNGGRHRMGRYIPAKVNQSVTTNHPITGSPPTQLTGKVKAAPLRFEQGDIKVRLAVPPKIIPNTTKSSGVKIESKNSKFDTGNPASTLPTAK